VEWGDEMGGGGGGGGRGAVPPAYQGAGEMEVGELWVGRDGHPARVLFSNPMRLTNQKEYSRGNIDSKGVGGNTVYRNEKEPCYRCETGLLLSGMRWGAISSARLKELTPRKIYSVLSTFHNSLPHGVPDCSFKVEKGKKIQKISIQGREGLLLGHLSEVDSQGRMRQQCGHRSTVNDCRCAEP